MCNIKITQRFYGKTCVLGIHDIRFFSSTQVTIEPLIAFMLHIILYLSCFLKLEQPMSIDSFLNIYVHL